MTGDPAADTAGRPTVAIVGCGRIARVHAANLAPRAHLAFTSRSSDSARTLAARFSGETLASFEEALERPDIAAVAICSPLEHHAAQTVAALKAGKSVLLEKPLAQSRAEVDAIGRALIGPAARNVDGRGELPLTSRPSAGSGGGSPRSGRCAGCGYRSSLGSTQPTGGSGTAPCSKAASISSRSLGRHRRRGAEGRAGGLSGWRRARSGTLISNSNTRPESAPRSATAGTPLRSREGSCSTRSWRERTAASSSRAMGSTSGRAPGGDPAPGGPVRGPHGVRRDGRGLPPVRPKSRAPSTFRFRNRAARSGDRLPGL